MGPTGSGKSAMAMAIAKSRPTVIINADAMQMVSDLRILTARPTPEEEAQAEHALYGVLRADEPTNVARWLAMVEPVIARALAQGKLPLLVGGTGMYVKALMGGLARVPPIPEAIRNTYRAMAAQDTSLHSLPAGESAHQFGASVGGISLHALLAARDPIMASKLKPGDTQRLMRALEVIEATGVSLDHWQQQAAAPLFPHVKYRCYYIQMPRAEVYRRIDARFHNMMQAGALEEVRALVAPIAQVPTARLNTLSPIYRAHGVPELIAYLRGEMTLEAAIAKAQQHTRNYAKRQMTWIRNQLPDAVAIDPLSPLNFTELSLS